MGWMRKERSDGGWKNKSFPIVIDRPDESLS